MNVDIYFDVTSGYRLAGANAEFIGWCASVALSIFLVCIPLYVLKNTDIYKLFDLLCLKLGTYKVLLLLLL
jgi:hypothetical protein